MCTVDIEECEYDTSYRTYINTIAVIECCSDQKNLRKSIELTRHFNGKPSSYFFDIPFVDLQNYFKYCGNFDFM